MLQTDKNVHFFGIGLPDAQTFLSTS